MLFGCFCCWRKLNEFNTMQSCQSEVFHNHSKTVLWFWDPKVRTNKFCFACSLSSGEVRLSLHLLCHGWLYGSQKQGLIIVTIREIVMVKGRWVLTVGTRKIGVSARILLLLPYQNHISRWTQRSQWWCCTGVSVGWLTSKNPCEAKHGSFVSLHVARFTA